MTLSQKMCFKQGLARLPEKDKEDNGGVSFPESGSPQSPWGK